MKRRRKCRVIRPRQGARSHYRRVVQQQFARAFGEKTYTRMHRARYGYRGVWLSSGDYKLMSLNRSRDRRGIEVYI